MTAAPITSYQTLQDAIADYLNRADLTTQITTFIQLAEAKFNRELRVADMLTNRSTTTAAETKAVATDFLEPYTLRLVTTTPRAPIEFKDWGEYERIRALNLTGDPRYFSLLGGSYYLNPAPTSTTTFSDTYYAKIPVLATGNTSNWLLVRSPDTYLYGSLLEAQPYLKDDDRLQTWAAIRQQGIDAINLESERAMRPRGQAVVSRRTGGFE